VHIFFNIRYKFHHNQITYLVRKLQDMKSLQGISNSLYVTIARSGRNGNLSQLVTVLHAWDWQNPNLGSRRSEPNYSNTKFVIAAGKGLRISTKCQLNPWSSKRAHSGRSFAPTPPKAQISSPTFYRCYWWPDACYSDILRFIKITRIIYY